MTTEQELRQKLRKIASLFEGATTAGERDAAAAAIGRILAAFSAAEQKEQTIEMQFRLSDRWHRRLFLALCRRYPSRVRQIVTRRLEMYGITQTPEQFFPEYEKQEEAIRSIAQEIKDNWPSEKRGYRPSDDVTRYARPEYIKRLQGPSKSGPTYKYAGFNQLVHVSSGIVRYFLESASLMYGEMRSRQAAERVESIDPTSQDKVVREQAKEFFFSEFDRFAADEGETLENLDRFKKLRNLILALGGTFHEILVSDAAERKVFSVALSDAPDDELLEIFRLGRQFGYFHESSIGNKEGTGRTRLYILSRRLAPFFNLDPTSFAGYKFVMCSVLREAMQKPNAFIRKARSGNVDQLLENPQIGLFEES